jgi:branched-chain amino acid transport system substrate-binding protein
MSTMRVIFLALLFWASVGEGEPLKVGAMLCQSGACADWGGAALKGAIFASEELNKRGGVLGRPVELVVEDSQDSISGARAVSALQSLLQRNITFLIGPSWAPGALAVAPIVARRRDLLIITPSASAPEFSRSSAFAFNMRPAEEASTLALVRFCIESGKRKVAILSSQQAAENRHGRLFKAEFEKLGGRVPLILEPQPSASDLRTEALQIAASFPDAVFLISYNQMESAARELAALGFKGARLTVSIDDARAKAAGGALEGVIVASAGEPAPWFKRRFAARFKEEPGLSAENGYDSLMALAHAMEAAGSFSPRAVRDALAGEAFEGAIGPVRFDENRQIQKAPFIRVVKSGRLVPLEQGPR